MADNVLSQAAVVPTQKSEETHAAYFALISLALHGLIAQIPANLVAPTAEKMSSVEKEVRVRLDFEDVTLQSLPPSLRYRSRIEALQSEKLAEPERERQRQKKAETNKKTKKELPEAQRNPLAAVLPESPEAQQPSTSPVAVPVEQAIAEASAFNRAQANAPKLKKPSPREKMKKTSPPEGKKEKKRISDEELLSGLFDVPADDSLRLRPDETVFAPSYPAPPAPPLRAGPVPSYMSNAMPSQVYPPPPAQAGREGGRAVIGSGGSGQGFASASGVESERNIQALDKYERALTAWIGQFQDVPAEAVRQNLHGAGVVMIEISRAGVVRNVSVIRSTGAPILDNAAKNMARASSPVVPVPPYYRPEEAFLRFAVPFRF